MFLALIVIASTVLLRIKYAAMKMPIKAGSKRKNIVIKGEAFP